MRTYIFYLSRSNKLNFQLDKNHLAHLFYLHLSKTVFLIEVREKEGKVSQVLAFLLELNDAHKIRKVQSIEEAVEEEERQIRRIAMNRRGRFGIFIRKDDFEISYLSQFTI